MWDHSLVSVSLSDIGSPIESVIEPISCVRMSIGESRAWKLGGYMRALYNHILVITDDLNIEINYTMQFCQQKPFHSTCLCLYWFLLYEMWFCLKSWTLYNITLSEYFLRKDCISTLWPRISPSTSNVIWDLTCACDMTDVVTRVVMRAGGIFMVTAAIFPCCCKSLMLREVSPDCHRLSLLSLPPSTPHVTQQQQQQWLYSNIHNSSHCQLYNNTGTHVHHVVSELSCPDNLSWLLSSVQCFSFVLSSSLYQEWVSILKIIVAILHFKRFLMFLQTFLLCNWPHEAIFDIFMSRAKPWSCFQIPVATTQGWNVWYLILSQVSIVAQIIMCCVLCEPYIYKGK